MPTEHTYPSPHDHHDDPAHGPATRTPARGRPRPRRRAWARPGQGRLRCQRLAAALLTVLLGAGGAAACSSQDEGAGASVPPLEEAASADASASAEASASGGATQAPSDGAAPSAGVSVTDPGEVTPQSLSDPDTELVITSVPEDLDEAQAVVVAAYAAHERAAWGARRDMDGRGRDDVEATTTGEALMSHEQSYQEQEEKGLHLEGSYTISIDEVVVEDDLGAATLRTCTDQRDARAVSASGEDQTRDTARHTFIYIFVLLRDEDGAWKVSQQDQAGVDQCEA